MRSAFGAAELAATELDHPERAAAARVAYAKLANKGPKEFSWFIYRMTNPTMRGLFMYPKNPLRVKEALLTVLAGDVHRKSPMWRSLLAFKAIYYLSWLRDAPIALRAWRARRRNVRQVGPTKGENVLVES
jgi:hypothetical protein